MPRLRYLIGNHVGRGEVRHDHGTWGRSVLPLSPGERSWVARSVPWILFFFFCSFPFHFYGSGSIFFNKWIFLVLG